MGGSIEKTRGKAAYRRASVAFVETPVNSVAPAVTGTATQGQTLTCSTGTWSKSPSYTYQWLRAGIPIVGATASTRLLAAGDVGSKMSCRVTATKNDFSASRTTAETATVVAS